MSDQNDKLAAAADELLVSMATATGADLTEMLTMMDLMAAHLIILVADKDVNSAIHAADVHCRHVNELIELFFKEEENETT